MVEKRKWTVDSFAITLLAACIMALSADPFAQEINWPDFVAKHDLTWTGIDNDFFHGAFIGDGVQGAMIMRDNLNPNALRMLMGHYKAIAHYCIPGYEFCTTRVYAGNIVVTPAGTPSSQTMRLNLWDGEASGAITTDKGTVTWSALTERKNLVFIVVTKSRGGETSSKLAVREEWGITPKFYLENKNPADYSTHLPPKPESSAQGDINLVINKMKTRGAHVVASQLKIDTGGTQVLYVAIGTDDNPDVAVAAQKATANAVARVQAAVQEGYAAITVRHRDWWHTYWKTSYLEIKEDAYWEKFWWLQLYKFACASSQTSDLIIDTQGPWIWKAAWAAIWWNLNAQLSYYPMYSANKLDAGRSFVSGMDRIYKSGAFRSNAGGTGITIGRASTYEGFENWGDEWGNMPWLLQSYWKYWRYSGNDSLAKPLFTMLKESAVFLVSKLEKGTDGTYHLLPSRSPEYTEDLHRDANYSLMSLRWVLQTLVAMDKELRLADPGRSAWQGKLDSLTACPADVNGLRVNLDQGFNNGHRHYSHLIGIYPYHIINPDQGADARNVIATSINRWQTLTQASGYAGYTFTGGCSMYATLGDGEKAVATLDLLKSRNLIQLNTMYNEGGGPVVETPLSAVESIDYMLLQSWNGKIRVFPALPKRWKNIAFKNFRTEGAFLVSASASMGAIAGITVFSEKGNSCTFVNPWAGKTPAVFDEAGAKVPTIIDGAACTFATKAGGTYNLTDGTTAARGSDPTFKIRRGSGGYCTTAGGLLRIALGSGYRMKHARVVDIRGKTVKAFDGTADRREYALDVSDLPAGVYTLVLALDGGRVADLVIKL